MRAAKGMTVLERQRVGAVRPRFRKNRRFEIFMYDGKSYRPMNASNRRPRSRPFERDYVTAHGNCRAPSFPTYGDIAPFTRAGAAHSAECFVYAAGRSPSPVSGVMAEG